MGDNIESYNQEELQNAISVMSSSMKKSIDISMSRLAVLIDSDNVPYSSVNQVISELEEYGEVTLKRAYGDFSRDEKKDWVRFCSENAINMSQTVEYRENKGTTDITLAIQAITMLHTGLYDGFCIVTSDSDFLPLAMTLKEYNKKVYIAGEEKTPDRLRKAGHEFILISNNEKYGDQIPKEIWDKVYKIFNKENLNDGWIPVAKFSQELEFDYKKYGYKKFKNFITRHQDIFETRWRGKNMDVRLKE